MLSDGSLTNEITRPRGACWQNFRHPAEPRAVDRRPLYECVVTHYAAVNAKAEQLDRLTHDLAESTDWSGYHQADEQFHQLVGTASGLGAAVETTGGAWHTPCLVDTVLDGARGVHGFKLPGARHGRADFGGGHASSVTIPTAFVWSALQRVRISRSATKPQDRLKKARMLTED